MQQQREEEWRQVLRRRRIAQLKMEREEEDINLYERRLLTADETRNDQNISSLAWFRQMSVFLVVSIGTFVSAMHMGFSTVAIPLLEKDVSLNITGGYKAKMVPFLTFVGAFNGAVFSFWSVKYGFKQLLLGSMIVSLASWQFLRKCEFIWQVGMSRFMGGLSLGIQTTVGASYIAGTFPAKFYHSAIPKTVTTVSGALGFLVMANMSRNHDWKELAWLGVRASLPQIILVNFIPESPRFLYLTAGWKKALQSFNWLYVDKRKAFSAFKEMKRMVKKTGEERTFVELLDECCINVISKLLSNDFLRTLLILQVCQQCTGVPFHFYMMTTLLENVSESHLLAQFCCIGTLVTNLVFSIFLSKYITPNHYKYLFYLSHLLLITLLRQFVFMYSFIYFKKIENVSEIWKFAFITVESSFYVTSYFAGWGTIPDFYLKDNSHKIGPMGMSTFYAIKYGLSAFFCIMYVGFCISYGNLADFLFFLCFMHLFNYTYSKYKTHERIFSDSIQVL